MKKRFKYPSIRRAKRPVTILKNARDVIAQGDWIRSDMAKPRQADGSVCFCAVGAVAYAAGWRPTEVEDGSETFLDDSTAYSAVQDDEPVRRALQLLSAEIPADAAPTVDRYGRPWLAHDRVISFNDRKGRRRRDVVRLFDRAIARAEGK